MLKTVSGASGGSSGFPITLGNTSITAGSTTTTLSNLTLNNVTINGTTENNISFSNVNVLSGNIANVTIANSTVTNVSITSGTENNVTYSNVTILSGNATLTKLTASNVIATANTATSSNVGAVQLGVNSFSDTGVLANFQSNLAGYNQVTVQNTSYANNASSEFIAYNNLGTASANFATVGINSSTYAGAGAVNAPGYGYFLSGSTDMVVGTIANNAIHFVANSSVTDAMVINANNTVTINALNQSTNANATMSTASIPLVPLGYIIVNNNGTNVKIPYYAV